MATNRHSISPLHFCVVGLSTSLPVGRKPEVMFKNPPEALEALLRAAYHLFPSEHLRGEATVEPALWCSTVEVWALPLPAMMPRLLMDHPPGMPLILRIGSVLTSDDQSDSFDIKTFVFCFCKVKVRIFTFTSTIRTVHERYFSFVHRRGSQSSAFKNKCKLQKIMALVGKVFISFCLNFLLCP